MIRSIAILAGALALSGCMEAASPVARGAGPASDGQAAKLKTGMSENAAFEVFGPESGFERNPANWDQSCLSYAYGSAEAPRYVHALFENGALVQATDGHAALCTFSAPQPAAT